MHPRPHPAMRHLERFIGDWDLTATFGGQAMKGVTSTFEWLENGALVVERTVAVTTDDVPEELLANSPLPTTRVIGYDDSSEIYSVLYVDARAVARVYQMRLTPDRWEIWRDAPGFGQRFIGEFDADGHTISGRWEKTFDNKTWEHDFFLTYTRATT
jgi:hypothetical protein